MSIFQRLTLQKSSFHFDVLFHEVSEFIVDHSSESAGDDAAAAAETTYYCSCERNSKRYRTNKSVLPETKKSLGLVAPQLVSSIAEGEESKSNLHLGARTHSEEAVGGGGSHHLHHQKSEKEKEEEFRLLQRNSVTFAPGKVQELLGVNVEPSLSHTSTKHAASTASTASAAPSVPTASSSSSLSASSPSSSSSSAVAMPPKSKYTNSTLSFDETLSFACSLYKSTSSSSNANAPVHQYAKKVFRLCLKSSSVDPSSAHGKKKAKKDKVSLYADVNLAAFASKGVRHATLVFPLTGKPTPPSGKAPPQLRVTITCMWMNDTGQKDKDGYSSCSSAKGNSRVSGTGTQGGGSSRFSRNMSSNALQEMSYSHYARNAAFANGVTGMDSREVSRSGFPVAFYGQDGMNVWDSQPGTGAILDGFPAFMNMDHSNVGMPPMNTNGGPVPNSNNTTTTGGATSSSSVAATAAGLVHSQLVGGVTAVAGALSVIRASAPSSRGNSRVASRAHSRNQSRNQSRNNAPIATGTAAAEEGGMEAELRQRRRDNEEDGIASSDPSWNSVYDSIGLTRPASNSFSNNTGAPAGRSRSNTAHKEEKNNNDHPEDSNNMTSPLHKGSTHFPANSPVSSASSGQHFNSGVPQPSPVFRPQSASLPLSPPNNPHALMMNVPRHHMSMDEQNSTYAELSSVDMLNSLLAGKEATHQQSQPSSMMSNGPSSPHQNHDLILASFRHPPPGSSLTSPLVPPRRPSIIQEEPQIHPLPLGSNNNAANAALRKQAVIDESRARNSSRRPTGIIAGSSSGGARTSPLLAGLILPNTNTNSVSSLTLGASAGANVPMSGGGGFGSLNGLSGPSSATSLSSPASASSADDWMNSIRAQLAPVQVESLPATAFGRGRSNSNRTPSPGPATHPSLTHTPSSQKTPNQPLPLQLQASLTLRPSPTPQTPIANQVNDQQPLLRDRTQSHEPVSTVQHNFIRNYSTPAPATNNVYHPHLTPHISISHLQIGAEGNIKIGEDYLAQVQAASRASTTSKNESNSPSSESPIVNGSLHSGGGKILKSFSSSPLPHSSLQLIAAPAVVQPMAVQQIASIHFDAFQSIERFHQGNQGVIWKAQLPAKLLPASSIRFAQPFLPGSQSNVVASPPLIDVIIKVPKHKPGPDEIAELFAFLNLPPHEHVLPFLGLCSDWRNPVLNENGASTPNTPARKSDKMFCMVTQRHGLNLKELSLSLPSWRANNTDPASNDPLLLLQILWQMAQGIAHLHRFRYVHRDISLRNFLLSLPSGVAGGSHQVLLADFGLCRSLDSGNSDYHDNVHANASYYESPASEHASLPLRWLAPECLLSHRFTLASDVYSFGVAAWELIQQSNQLPYQEVDNMREVVAAVCTGDLRLNFQAKCSKGLEKVLLKCLQISPSKRPDIQAVAKSIHKLIRKQYGSPTTIGGAVSSAHDAHEAVASGSATAFPLAQANESPDRNLGRSPDDSLDVPVFHDEGDLDDDDDDVSVEEKETSSSSDSDSD